MNTSPKTAELRNWDSCTNGLTKPEAAVLIMKWS